MQTARNGHDLKAADSGMSVFTQSNLARNGQTLYAVDSRIARTRRRSFARNGHNVQAADSHRIYVKMRLLLEPAMLAGRRQLYKTVLTGTPPLDPGFTVR